MARINVNGLPILTFESDPYIGNYWDIELSTHVINNYGKGKVSDHDEVEAIFISCFNLLIEKFSSIIEIHKSEHFFHHVFSLHEASIDILIHQMSGNNLPDTIKADFAMYRRGLKLIIEQACSTTDIFVEDNPKSIDEYDQIVQELYYLTHWIYGFADYTALYKMIESFCYIEFEDDILTIGYQNFKGELYKMLMKEFSPDYETFFDTEATAQMRSEIEKNFQINYDIALGIPEGTLAINDLISTLSAKCGISEAESKSFYEGLIISRGNVLTIQDAVLKPHSINRYFFRPFLSYKVGADEKILVSPKKVQESILVISTNAIHWNTMSEEWKQNVGMREFLNRKGDEHDSLLEDEFEKIIKNELGYPYCRNVKSFRQRQGNNVSIDVRGIGEIDFVVINKDLKRVFIADTKYNKARYEAVGYRMDNTNFIKYETQVENKFNWLKDNLTVLQEHLELEFQIEYSVLDFEIEALFFINTPTFYMFNGKFKAITSLRVKEYLEGTWDMPTLSLFSKEENLIYKFKHPYFKLQPKISHA